VRVVLVLLVVLALIALSGFVLARRQARRARRLEKQIDVLVEAEMGDLDKLDLEPRDDDDETASPGP
jgi:flagellar biogenesis protein FliO